MAFYDLEEKVSEEANEHFHEAHKKKSIHDLAEFDHKYHADNLLIEKNKDGSRRKSQMTEEELLGMLPTVLL